MELSNMYKYAKHKLNEFFGNPTNEFKKIRVIESSQNETSHAQDYYSDCSDDETHGLSTVWEKPIYSLSPPKLVRSS